MDTRMQEVAIGEPAIRCDGCSKIMRKYMLAKTRAHSGNTVVGVSVAWCKACCAEVAETAMVGAAEIVNLARRAERAGITAASCRTESDFAQARAAEAALEDAFSTEGD
jgi:hypothetical protein